MMRCLFYFGPNSSIDSISRLLSPIRTNSSEKDQVEQLEILFVSQNLIAYISHRWVIFIDWLIILPANSILWYSSTFSCSVFTSIIDRHNQREVATAADLMTRHYPLPLHPSFHDEVTLFSSLLAHAGFCPFMAYWLFAFHSAIRCLCLAVLPILLTGLRYHEQPLIPLTSDWFRLSHLVEWFLFTEHLNSSRFFTSNMVPIVDNYCCLRSSKF